MRETVLNRDGVLTHVVIEGQDSMNMEEIIPRSSKSVVLTIPGNPGLPEFYKEFISAVISRVPAGTPTLIIGHAGHVQPPEGSGNYIHDKAKWKDNYSLKGQLKQKEEFINKYVPQDADLYFIGHSIGCWFILNLLKNQLIAKRTVKCYMLFPTIEHMAATSNGRFFTGFVTRVSRFIGFLVQMFTYLPLNIKLVLIRLYGRIIGMSPRYVTAIQQLINPHVLNMVFRLAREEMRYVKQLDDSLVSKHADKLWLYYGASDGWSPVKYYENMRSTHPNVDAHLCQLGFDHSFVLKSAIPMGHMVGDLINNDMSKS